VTAADPFLDLVRALHHHRVRFVLIGVSGVNYYASRGSLLFTTADHDLFLPLDTPNTLGACHAAESRGLELSAGVEPLDVPHDETVARAVVDRRALVMAGFDFETVWQERRTFVADGTQLPVARLAHIINSKATAGRQKHRLFLATYAEGLEALLKRDTETAAE
jgi:hypothetical protein